MNPAAKRERARRIRDVAAGFDDQVSRALIGLAEGLEIEAAQDEAKLGMIDLQRHREEGRD